MKTLYWLELLIAADILSGARILAGRLRNNQAYQLMNYRGSRSGLKRVKAAIPAVRLQNDIEGEEVTITIPLS